MPTSPALKLTTAAVGAATLFTIVGCSSPNSATGTGTPGMQIVASGPTASSGTTTTTSTAANAFGPSFPGSNAQAFAQPNSALVVYIPDRATQSTTPPELVLSPASGYAFGLAYGTKDNRPAASVSLAANTPGVRSIDTSRLQQPLVQTYSGTNYAGYNGTWSFLDVWRPTDSNNNPILTDAYVGLMYLNSNTFEGARAVFHGGAATPVQQMPTTASATYNGQFEGTESRGNNSLNISYSAPMRMTANFGAGTVSGTVDQTPFGQMSLKFDGTISGNSYQGTAAMVAPPGQTTTTNSALNGAFYGTNASQTAGAITVQGTQSFGASNPNSPVTIYGTYGAKR